MEGEDQGNVSVVRKNNSSTGRGIKKKSPARIRRRSETDWWVADGWQPSAVFSVSPGSKTKDVGGGRKGKKRRGIKRWMEFKDARQMDSGDARRAPSTRN